MLRQHFFYVKILRDVALFYRAILKRRHSCIENAY